MAEDENPWTPLQIASHDGEVVLVSSLLDKGADTNAGPQGWYGRTALQAASQNGHLEIIQKLLNAGAKVNCPGGNNGGHTALTLAARAGLQEIVELLINSGAHINIPPHRYMGRIPLQAAAEGGNIAIVNILMDHGAFVNAPPARTGNQEMVKRLIQAEARINARGSYYNGVTALYAAVEAGHVEVVRTLLIFGAERDMTAGNKHWTALRAARFHGYMNIVELLESEK
jgi:ankyrin repeat protein